MSAFDKDCPRCASYKKRGLPPPALLKVPRDIDPEPVQETITSPMPKQQSVLPQVPHLSGLACATCHAPLVAGSLFCNGCGMQFTQTVPMATQNGQKQERADGGIFLMWLFTILAWVFGVGINPLVGFGVDLIALILAVVLVTGTNQAGKTNAKVKFGLEVFAFLAAFLQAASRTSGG